MDTRALAGIVVALVIGLAIGYGVSQSKPPATVTTTLPGETITVTSTVTATTTETMMEESKEFYTVKLAYKPGIGFYLVDANGMTLYFFAKDYDGKSKCYGECAAKWPPFYTDDIKPSPGLDPNDFSVITRDDGSKQVTYKGWPLYYFIKDKEPGDVYGDGVKDVWFVAKPDYTVMVAVKEGLGAYLVTGDGMTLYFFAKDMDGKSMCYGACAEKWPIYSPRSLVVPSTLNLTDFTFITRDDGSIQLAYKGRPLYLWVNDQARGDTTGHGVKGVWFVASITGDLGS